MMDIKGLCDEYCIGCGLCQTSGTASMKRKDSGYLHPLFQSEGAEKYLSDVCPVTGLHATRQNNLWGEFVSCTGGYSKDEAIRKQASSGGVITALAIFLLDSKRVDGVIQVKASKENPIETICVISRTSGEVRDCCGSRYSISSPWLDLEHIISDTETYAAVGKPCDIAALRNCKNIGKYENIKYLFSFFCAGLPSKNANIRLLTELGCGEEECKSLIYRGNGWPGYTTATDLSGQEYQMEYSKSWGGILGRDVHPFCRLCLDGIGEAADIACGDGWYMKSDGEPDFTERDGRNVIFARTLLGQELLNEAESAITFEAWDDVNILRKIQKYQYTRRATMGTKILAYRLMGRKVPEYSKVILKQYAKEISFKEKMRVFLGTIKRILQHKI